ncbi:unnamed protein product [Onchocerca flexuosa]|uniref:Uncharacterized protein n=1 Tax=Onchocerca flexuosa TaxID=387005 RepID=A0A183HPI5_9BILA|nr:unnamed protein product [Onchocerca flexuosa]
MLFDGGKGCFGRGGSGGTYHLVHHLGSGFAAFPGPGGLPTVYPVAGFGGLSGAGISPQTGGFYPPNNLCNAYGSYGNIYPCYPGYSGNNINCWYGRNYWYGKTQLPQYYPSQSPCKSYHPNCNYYPPYYRYYYLYRH